MTLPRIEYFIKVAHLTRARGEHVVTDKKMISIPVLPPPGCNLAAGERFEELKVSTCPRSSGKATARSVSGAFDKFLGIFARIRICGGAREYFGDPRRLLMTRYFSPTFIGSRADDSAASEALQLGEMFGERIKRTFASFVCATTEIQFRDAADSSASSGSLLSRLASQRDRAFPDEYSTTLH